jgi:hypothetical protein
VTYRSNLAESVWHDLTNGIPGTGGQIEVPDPALDGKRFYRINVKLQ